MKYVTLFVLTLFVLFKGKNKKVHCIRTNKIFPINVIQQEFPKRNDKLFFIINTNNIKRGKILKNEEMYQKKKKKKKKGIPLLGRDNRNPYLAFEYVNKIIENKKYEVRKLMEEHSDDNSPLQIRLKYLQYTMNNKLSESLKRKSEDEKHRLSVVADLKRKTFYRSETFNKKEEIFNEKEEMEGMEGMERIEEIYDLEKKRKKQNESFPNPLRENSLLHLQNPGNAYKMLYKLGVDAVIVNIDSLSADGNIHDLYDIVKTSRQISRIKRPAIIFNDIIIHPIQIALAVENKADAVLLNFTFLKEDVEQMLHYCINMGIEAIVEVHDYNEIYYATKYGACIIMINEYNLLNNTYEYNHAIKALNYTIPEIVTIAKIDINEKNDINYIEHLGSLCYDSICLENKLKDEDLGEFILNCKKWSAPNKTLMHLNRNNYLKECLNPEGSITSEKHKNMMKTLQDMYGNKNVKNDYAKSLLKKYEEEVMLENNDDHQKTASKGGNKEISEKKETSEKQTETHTETYTAINTTINTTRDTEIEMDTKQKLEKSRDPIRLTNEENKIVNNFKEENKKQLLFLNQLRELMKEVDNHCRQSHLNDYNIDGEYKKREEKLESLLENFTKLDRSFLKEFFSDEEIANIENSIRTAIQKKNKDGNNLHDSDNKKNDSTTNDELINNFDIQKLAEDYFDYDTKDSSDENETTKLLDDTSDNFPRGLSSE